MRIRPAHSDELPRLQDIERAAGHCFRDIGMPEIADDEPPALEVLARHLRAGLAWVAVDPSAAIDVAAVAPSPAVDLAAVDSSAVDVAAVDSSAVDSSAPAPAAVDPSAPAPAAVDPSAPAPAAVAPSALDPSTADVPVAYLIADRVDGNLHVEQVSVHPGYARRGIGRSLLDHLADRAAADAVPALTLTTFRDVPWNAPYYARCGFAVLGDEAVGPELRAVREEEAALGLNRWPRVCMWRPVRCRASPGAPSSATPLSATPAAVRHDRGPVGQE